MISSQALARDPAALQIHTSEDPPASIASPGKTLLPGTVASIVSTITGATSLGVRIGSKVGGFWIAGARETTLTSLELTRAALEAVLTAAGRDVSRRTNGELGRVEAENILERSVRFPSLGQQFLWLTYF